MEKIITWNNDGSAIVIHDQEGLVEHLLPTYFNHRNLPSFLRYLLN